MKVTLENCIIALAVKNLSKFTEPEHFSVFLTGYNKTLSWARLIQFASSLHISRRWILILPVPVAARWSTAARLLRLWVRIPPGAWMYVCCECCVFSGRRLCDELITHPEESYRLWCVVMCDLETSWMRRPWPTGAVAPKKYIILELMHVARSSIFLEVLRLKLQKNAVCIRATCTSVSPSTI
jgi:hypothetical protein